MCARAGWTRGSQACSRGRSGAASGLTVLQHNVNDGNPDVPVTVRSRAGLTPTAEAGVRARHS
jgi:hypothetical protein